MLNSYIMSPPEVWGPAVWRLFHTLIEKMNPELYSHVIGSTFGMIVQICKVLPCPECSKDASSFLAKINLKDYKTKDEFKNMLYLFHNWVNAKKRKPLFNHAYMNIYSKFNLTFVIKDFISKYNTKGNMKLLTESFQRGFVVKNLMSWFKTYYRAFIRPSPIINMINNNSQQLEAIQEEPLVEEPLVEEPLVKEENIVEPLVEEPLVEEPLVEEPLVEEKNIVEEPLLEEPLVEEHLVEEENNVEESYTEEILITDEVQMDESFKVEEASILIQEPVAIEEPIIIQQPKKKRNNKKKNNLNEP